MNERASKNRVCEGLFTRALDGVPAESALVFMITTRRSSYYFLSVISRGDDEGVAAALPQSAPRRVVPAALAVQIARFFYTQPQDTLGVDFPDWLSFLSARLPDRKSPGEFVLISIGSGEGQGLPAVVAGEGG